MSLASRIATRLAGDMHSIRKTAKPAEDIALSLFDVGLRRRAAFQKQRQTSEYQSIFDDPSPLVSICVATYNRAQLLRERAVRSLLSQTYTNIEVIVVGDCCTDDTASVLAKVDDPRLRFINLAQRGAYPEEPRLRWMVAGTTPTNHALSLAKGSFISHLDDDDEHEPERVERLINHIRASRADLLFHPFRFEDPDGDWMVNEARSFRWGQATTSSIFYHRHFASIGWDPLAYRRGEPGDWNRLRKIAFIGARIERNPGIFLKHYRERNQRAA